MAKPPIYTPSSSLIQQTAKLFLAAPDFSAFGTATLTREAKGKYYWSIPASGTVQLAASLSTILRNFRSAVVNYQFKGVDQGALSLKSVTANYLITVANATSGAVTLSATTFPADNTVTTPTVIDLLAAAQGALSTGFRANLYQTVLTPANTGLLPLATDELTAEVIFVTPASSVIRFYGLALDLNYNI